MNILCECDAKPVVARNTGNGGCDTPPVVSPVAVTPVLNGNH